MTVLDEALDAALTAYGDAMWRFSLNPGSVTSSHKEAMREALAAATRVRDEA